jgi:hypothetical protein
MSTANPFTPTGNTITFTASSVAAVGVQATSSTLGSIQYLIQNAGPVVAFLGVGGSNTVAQTNAATVTSSQPAIPLLPSSIQVLTLPSSSFFSGSASANCGIYITPGEGV